jgi:hypothetical protein
MRKMGVRSLVDLVRPLNPSNSVGRRDPRRKRPYNLFARLYVFFARLYDFILLLSSAVWISSLHALGYSLPGLGARRENSSRCQSLRSFQ